MTKTKKGDASVARLIASLVVRSVSVCGRGTGRGVRLQEEPKCREELLGWRVRLAVRDTAFDCDVA